MARLRPRSESETSKRNGPAAEILSALERLDTRLAAAAGLVREATGEDPGGASFRGLYITQDDVGRLLARQPGAPLFARTGRAATGASEGRLAQLARLYSLTVFDLDVLMLALAPEVDQRYHTLYAYLQDDVNRQRPTVGLALDLLCETRAERVQRRTRFAAGAPLLRSGILRLTPEAGETTLLLRALFVDEGIAAWLMGSDELDHRLLPLVREMAPAPAPVADGLLLRPLVNMLTSSRRRA